MEVVNEDVLASGTPEWDVSQRSCGCSISRSFHRVLSNLKT